MSWNELNYFKDTDTLYIDLTDATSVESEEIAPGVVVDFGADGTIVGFEMEHASETVDMTKLETRAFPPEVQQLAV